MHVLMSVSVTYRLSPYEYRDLFSLVNVAEWSPFWKELLTIDPLFSLYYIMSNWTYSFSPFWR